MKASLIALDYQGVPVSFNEEGWINATEIAAHYGKEVYEWLRLPDTQRYLEALCRRHGINRGNPGYWVKARRGKSGGTWLHPRLGVRFAQWLNVDFAVWCDEQIETLLIQQHPHFDWKRQRHEAASSFKVMQDILATVRADQGKPTAAHHYINEARLVNWALSGAFATVDREALSVHELNLLARLELKNATLIGRGVAYADRKKILESTALESRVIPFPTLPDQAA